MSLAKVAISGVKWSIVGTVGLSIFQILQISILTRYLSKDEFGLIAMALFTLNLTSIFADMGMTTAILHRQDATKNEYSSIYWLNIFISLFLYVILFIMAPIAAEFYNEPDLHAVITILGVNLLLMAAGRQHRTIMQKQFQFKSIAITELFSYLCGLIAAITLAIQGFGVYSLVYSSLLSSGISNGLFLVQNLKLNPIGFHFKFSDTNAFLKIGGYTTGSSLLDFFSREIDILIIGKLLGAESLGVYSLMKQIVVKLRTLINPIILNVLNPLLASIQKRKDLLKSTYLKLIRNLSYFNFMAFILLAINSKEILSVVYGQSYSQSYWVLVFLSFSYCLDSVSSPAGSLQIATGRTDIGFKWTIIRLIITPLVIFIAAKYSIETVAAFYMTLSITLLLPMWFVQLKPMASIKFGEYLTQFYKPLLFYFMVLIILFFYSDLIFSSTNLFLSIVLKTTVVVALFSIYIYITDKKSLLDTFEVVFKRKIV
jgi:O-antigen/teichoic acid export membrane protein